MARFFETFQVAESDGDWTSGYVFDTVGGTLSFTTVDICNPGARSVPADGTLGRDARPFAFMANGKVPTRCAPESFEQAAVEMIRESTEYHVTKTLWHGITSDPDYDVALTSSEVETVAVGTNPYATLGAVISRAYAKNPFIKPVIHLGFESAMSLQLGLNTIGLPYVIGPGYPPDAVAVTGPVVVRLTPGRFTVSVDPDDNRKYVEGERLCAIELDPLLAIRAAT